MAAGRHIRRRDPPKSARIVAAAARTAADPAAPAEPAAVVHAGARVLTSTIRINGTVHAVSHEARVSLLDLLRERLDLTGTKKGCNEGACGACTVLVDGRRVNACMILAASCDGRDVTTIEGLAARDGTLHAVQQAFIDQDAFQCGYCTPGQIVSAVACIEEGHVRSEVEIAEWMSGNICRCAAYPQIVAAVQQAASRRARTG
jgi:xanthine dehydrogenase YagT iron-sulfur-binding subunit